MPNYNKLREICESNGRMSVPLIDDFLIYYAASRENLDAEMRKRLAPYLHIARKLDQTWINKIMAQYIAHRIFKKGGLIQKYLKQNALKQRRDDERHLLEQHASNPWRFSYSVIIENPAEDFYEMEDVFTGDTFLLFSPGVTRTLTEQSTILWFNLIGFNGGCWQTFGPIGAYRGFDEDDIFFFATELHPNLESGEDLLKDVEANPFPFMMLFAGSAYPLTMHGDDPIVHVVSYHELDAFTSERLSSHFIIEHEENIYRLSLKGWEEHPHFSIAYYDEKKKLLMLTALTDRGFQALVSQLNVSGFNFPDEPQVRVSIAMTLFAGEVLKRKIRLNPYETLFTKETTPAVQQGMDNLNRLLQMAMPEINAGREPDIDTLAAKAGVDAEAARGLMESVMRKVKEKRGR